MKTGKQKDRLRRVGTERQVDRIQGGKEGETDRETATTKGENILPLSGFREVWNRSKCNQRNSFRNPRLSEIRNC